MDFEILGPLDVLDEGVIALTDTPVRSQATGRLPKPHPD
jgi:hypothetical protein